MTLSLPPFEPLVPAALYPTLSLLLVGSGLVFMAWFFTLSTGSPSASSSTSAKNSSGQNSVGRLIKELTVAAIASVLLGTGLLFVCLNVGIYV